MENRTSCHAMVMVMTRAKINFSINFPNRHTHTHTLSLEFHSNGHDSANISRMLMHTSRDQHSQIEISGAIMCSLVSSLASLCFARFVHISFDRDKNHLPFEYFALFHVCDCAFAKYKYFFIFFHSLFLIAGRRRRGRRRCSFLLLFTRAKKAISLIQHRLDECVTSASSHYHAHTHTHHTHSIFFLLSSPSLFVSVLKFLFAFVRLWRFFSLFFIMILIYIECVSKHASGFCRYIPKIVYKVFPGWWLWRKIFMNIEYSLASAGNATTRMYGIRICTPSAAVPCVCVNAAACSQTFFSHIMIIEQGAVWSSRREIIFFFFCFLLFSYKTTFATDKYCRCHFERMKMASKESRARVSRCRVCCRVDKNRI